MTLKNIIPWIFALVLAALLLLATCNRRSDTTTPPVVDRQAVIDSLNTEHAIDSAVFAWQRDSIAAEKEQVMFERDMLTQSLVGKESRINGLNKLITALRKDTGYTEIVLDNCDSLVAYSGGLLNDNALLRAAQAELDRLHKAELAVRDTAISDCDIAYASAVDAAVKEIEAFSAYRKSTAPRASLYAGFTGGSNFRQTTAGPSLMYRGRGGRTQIMGAYEVGNTQPVYRAGIYKRISLKRK